MLEMDLEHKTQVISYYMRIQPHVVDLLLTILIEVQYAI